MSAQTRPAHSPGRSGRWALAGSLAAVVVIFFTAARLLPPIDTHATSVASEAGYTNQLLPLVAILIGGAALLGAMIVRNGRLDAPWEAAPCSADRTAPPYWRWQVLAAAALCVAVVTLVPTWSEPTNYFGGRVTMMAGGKRPYIDFEYAYGALVAYLPYALHEAGLSIQASLELTLSLAVVIGVASLAVVTARWLPDPRFRVAMFWTLVACEAFVDPGPSLNYNFARYAAPFALLVGLARAMPRCGPLAMFAIVAAANTLPYLISPEVGCAFSVAVLTWIAAGARFTPWPKLVAGIAGVTASVDGLVVFERPMFSTLAAYSQSQVLMPVVPNLIMTLFVVCFLAIGAAAVAAVWALWRGRTAPEAVRANAELVGSVALGAALLPAVIGRSWPTITIAYGFVPIVILIGRLLTFRATKTAGVVAALFGLFVAYAAWSGLRFDLGRVRADAEGRIRPGPATTVRGHPPQMLLGRFRGAYDPLAFIYPTAPPITDVGYYPGLRAGDVTTEAAVARKLAELRRAPLYVIPARRDVAIVLEGAPANRALSGFARAGLYPFPLAVSGRARPIGASFVDLLYDQCDLLASADGLDACSLRKEPQPPH